MSVLQITAWDNDGVHSHGSTPWSSRVWVEVPEGAAFAHLHLKTLGYDGMVDRLA
jgi:hypothetical protein